MRLLNKITDKASQRYFLTGNPGQRIVMDLRFLSSQSLWSMDLSWNGVSIKNIQVVASPNILRKFSNVIPFGIACVTKDGLDPYFIDDFSTKRASFYLLSEEDVAVIEAGLFE